MFDLFTDQSITYTINTSASISTTYSNCFASHAIDVKVLQEDPTNDTILCQACSVAQPNHDDQPWLQLDLGNKYLINTLKVYGRGMLP